jgi:hypothetical protein
MNTEERLLEIISHLTAADMQSLPSDDQIIMNHVRDALKEAQSLRRELAKELA